MRILTSLAILPAFVVGVLFSATASAQQDRSAATITISAAPGHDWKVTYRLPQPAAKLAFARSPDTSRTKTWVGADGFELVATPTGEVAQRRDGAKFDRGVFDGTAALFLSARRLRSVLSLSEMAACFFTARGCSRAQIVCSEGAAWSLKLDAPGWNYILVDGRRARRSATWIDKGEGQSVYVGSTPEVETRDLIAVIDGALPVWHSRATRARPAQVHELLLRAARRAAVQVHVVRFV